VLALMAFQAVVMVDTLRAHRPAWAEESLTAL